MNNNYTDPYFSCNNKKGSEEKPNAEKLTTAGKRYDIPIRALITKDVKGLMMAGRCISVNFVVHSSYLVTGNAAIIEQGAGRVAKLAA